MPGRWGREEGEGLQGADPLEAQGDSLRRSLPPPVPPTPLQVRVIHAAAEAVFAAAGGTRVPYKVGTMIEVPRGALRAGDLAKHAQFFSFGTNDLTQVF